MFWATFVTIWIIISTIVRTVKQPKLCRLQGRTEAQLMGDIIGSILWGLGMITALYMAGLYT